MTPSENDAKLRGEYLISVTNIERQISSVIATLFYPEQDNHWRLILLLLHEKSLSLERKNEILTEFLRLKYPDLLEKYPSPRIMKDIFSLREDLGKRNPDEPDLNPHLISFVHVEPWEIRGRSMDMQGFKSELEKCNLVSQMLTEIENELKKRSKERNNNQSRTPKENCETN